MAAEALLGEACQHSATIETPAAPNGGTDALRAFAAGRIRMQTVDKPLVPYSDGLPPTPRTHPHKETLSGHAPPPPRGGGRGNPVRPCLPRTRLEPESGEASTPARRLSEKPVQAGR
jgi:hypothetical protein